MEVADMERSDTSQGTSHAAAAIGLAGDAASKVAELKKIKAETIKLEAETRTILDELKRPWHRKRYFYQAVVAGLVAVPLIWFYVLPLSRISSIDDELKNRVEKKTLADRNDELEQERRVLLYQRHRFLAQLNSYDKLLDDIQKKNLAAEKTIISLRDRASRLEAEVQKAPVSTKSTLWVATLGQEGHGKSTLTAAITRVLSYTGGASFVPYAKIANSSEISVQGIRIKAAQVKYETDKASYIHIDCRSDADCDKLLTSREIKLDGAILVAPAADGPTPKTLEHIRLARRRSLRTLIVYLNKVDLVNDRDIIDLIELEVRELLTENGFDGNTAPIIRGSALMALTDSRDEIGETSVLELLSAMDEWLGR